MRGASERENRSSLARQTSIRTRWKSGRQRSYLRTHHQRLQHERAELAALVHRQLVQLGPG